MPIPYRKFKGLVEAEFCTIEITKQGHGKIWYENVLVSTFAKTHGKNTKRDEIKDVYVKDFMKKVQLVKQRMETNDE